MGRKLAMRGAVDRRGDQHTIKITRERQMHNKEEKETQCHLMRFVDIIFLHLSCYQVKWRGSVWAENEGESVQFSWRENFF
jgi:hypothetical protein